MDLWIPELSLVLLVGPSGSGKSTFARRHFRGTEILASDAMRGLICDDESNQLVSRDAFEALHLLTAKRLAWRRLTVIDATNLRAEARRPLLGLARRYHYLTSAIVFNLAEAECQANNLLRLDRRVETNAIHAQAQMLPQTIAQLHQERLDQVVTFSSLAEVNAVRIERPRMAYDCADLSGPFDIIGDVHGCFEELLALLTRLRYQVEERREDNGERRYLVTAPAQRKLVFVGDLIDRGPRSSEVARLVMDLVAQGLALCVTGNHDDKLRRHLEGRDVTITQGLAETLSQLDREGPRFRERLLKFLDNLPSHYLLDGGKLVVAHAGLREDLQGRESRRVRAFALYGETTGATDEYGLPMRGNWGQTYTGRALVVHGHTPVTYPQWFNRTLNIDTGCVFGGTLTALRYPENELVSVPSGRAYCPAPRPFMHHGPNNSANLPVVDRSLKPRLPTPDPGNTGASVEPRRETPS